MDERTEAEARADAAQLATALFDLRQELTAKCKRLGRTNWWGDRGTPVTCLETEGGGTTRLFVGEAGYRHTFYPRLFWTSRDVPGLTLGVGHIGAVIAVIAAERSSGDLLAKIDARWARTLFAFREEWISPTGPDSARLAVDEITHELRIARTHTALRGDAAEPPEPPETAAVPDWETIDDDTHRLAVPGGWLYRVCAARFADGVCVEVSVSTAFVPDTTAPHVRRAPGAS